MEDIAPTKTAELRARKLDQHSLGQLIVKHTDISWEDVQNAMEICEATGTPLAEQLYLQGRLSVDNRAKCLAMEWGLPYADVSKEELSLDAVNLIDLEYQRNNKILPLRIEDSVLFVGLVDPLQVNLMDEVRLITGYEAKAVVVSEEQLTKKHDELFGTGEDPDVFEEACIDSIVEDVQMQMGDTTQGEAGYHELSGQMDEAAVIRLVNSFLLEGIQNRSSDIHIQGEKNRTQVRYRTNDAPSAVTRLANMGVQPFLIASSLAGVLAQRLVRRICNKCKEGYIASPQEVEGLPIATREDGKVHIFRAKGCTACFNSGYNGRCGIYELLTVTEPIQRLILDRAPDADIRIKAVEEGMQTLHVSVCQRAFIGLTTLEEAHRVVHIGGH